MKALVCEGPGKGMTFKTVPTPEVQEGSVIVKVLAAVMDANVPHILSGDMGFTFPSPFIPGSRAIGRVAQTGPDTTSLSEGQLVFVEPHVRARDDSDVQILFGMWEGMTPQSKKLMENSWRNSGFAEFVKVPLENCWALNEEILCKKMGYTIPELSYITTQAVSFGGFRGINLQPGETVIVSPATGISSGAAVGVATAMGANVIAVSRNIEELQKLQKVHPRVNIVQTKGDIQEDTAAIMKYGPVDAYLDLSPARASASTHIRSCFLALKTYGRASLMGVVTTDIPIPYNLAVLKALTIRAQYMYERSDIRALIKMVESGLLKLGKEGGQEVVGEFKFEEVDEAIKVATQNAQAGKIVVFTP